MKRKDCLTAMRVAGYHNDRKTYTRLLIENRVSIEAGREQYELGQFQRQSGMRCDCHECKKGIEPLTQSTSFAGLSLRHALHSGH